MIFGFFVMKNIKLALKFRNFWKFLENKSAKKSRRNSWNWNSIWIDFQIWLLEKALRIFAPTQSVKTDTFQILNIQVNLHWTQMIVNYIVFHPPRKHWANFQNCPLTNNQLVIGVLVNPELNCTSRRRKISKPNLIYLERPLPPDSTLLNHPPGRNISRLQGRLRGLHRQNQK